MLLEAELKSVQEVQCPCCRTVWGPFTWRSPPPAKKRTQPLPRLVHPGTRCHCCGATPIVGVRCVCRVCAAVSLCGPCFADGWHPEHNFLAFHKPNSRGEPVERSLMAPTCSSLRCSTAHPGARTVACAPACSKERMPLTAATRRALADASCSLASPSGSLVGLGVQGSGLRCQEHAGTTNGYERCPRPPAGNCKSDDAFPQPTIVSNQRQHGRAGIRPRRVLSRLRPVNDPGPGELGVQGGSIPLHRREHCSGPQPLQGSAGALSSTVAENGDGQALPQLLEERSAQNGSRVRIERGAASQRGAHMVDAPEQASARGSEHLCASLCASRIASPDLVDVPANANLDVASGCEGTVHDCAAPPRLEDIGGSTRVWTQEQLAAGLAVAGRTATSSCGPSRLINSADADSASKLAKHSMAMGQRAMEAASAWHTGLERTLGPRKERVRWHTNQCADPDRLHEAWALSMGINTLEEPAPSTTALRSMLQVFSGHQMDTCEVSTDTCEVSQGHECVFDAVLDRL